MIGYSSRASVVALLAASMAVSGCLGSGRSGGGDGGGAQDTAAGLAEVKALGFTTNMPTQLQASYQGAMRAEIRDAGGMQTAAAATSPALAVVTADLEIDVAWDESMGVNADISGEASNFQATNLEPDDDDPNFALDGTLTVGAGSGGIVREEITAEGVTVATGAISFELSGTLTDTEEGESFDVYLGLGGAFYGDDAQAIAGTVSGVITAPGQQVPIFAVGGEEEENHFYLIKRD